MTPETRRHIFTFAEIGDDGRITYDCRFDEDDFEGAYRELERRYYAGEGAAFAEAGDLATEWMIALNRVISTGCSASSPHPISVSRTGHDFGLFGERSAAEFRASLGGTRTRWSPRREHGSQP